MTHNSVVRTVDLTAGPIDYLATGLAGAVGSFIAGTARTP
jgi:hypothetical protein